jgi:hypothetical protein
MSNALPAGHVDRTSNPTVIEYAVCCMIQKGKSISAAAKHCAKNFTGYENAFFGPGVAFIDEKELAGLLWDRMVDVTIKSISKLKEGKEHFALGGTLTTFSQKPKLRDELKCRVIAKLGSDPFTSDDGT